MAIQPRTHNIRPMESYVEMADNNILTVSTNVHTNMDGNDKFPNPPVDLKELKTNNDNFSALIAEAVDRSRKVIAQKNQMREVIIKDLRLLGRYVEKIAAADLATFTSSGFTPAPKVRTPQATLSTNFRSVDRGSLSGQLLIRLKAIPNALSYELRYAAMTNGAAGAWTYQLVTRVKTPVTLSGLTRGMTYTFQARSMGLDGYSDWSDSVTTMCV